MICLPGLLDNSTDPTNFSHWPIDTADIVVGTYSFRIELITARVKGEALSVVYVLIIAACLKAVRHMRSMRENINLKIRRIRRSGPELACSILRHVGNMTCISRERPLTGRQ